MPTGIYERKVKAKKPEKIRRVKPQESKPCGFCGLIIQKRPTCRPSRWGKLKFCSSTCVGLSQRAENKPGGKDGKICQQCGEFFTKEEGTGRSGWSKKKYCSMECLGESISKRQKGRKLSEESKRKISAANLANPNRYWLGRKRSPETLEKMGAANRGKKYPPRSEESRQKMRDAWPGMKERGFKPPKHIIPHTEESKKKMRETPRGRGENCHNWKGGRTSSSQIIRTSKEYKEWRKAVFERDGYVCVIGGKDHGNRLHADHIQRFSDFPDLRMVVANGRTLCEECHRATETYGRGRNNKIKQAVENEYATV